MGRVFRQVSIGFHNLPLFMGGKKKWYPRNPYAGGIFHLICPACKAWHSVIQPLNATACLCLVTILSVASTGKSGIKSLQTMQQENSNSVT